MTFYHLHHTELRINLMKHRHRISSFVVFILLNKKCFVNIFLCKKYFYSSCETCPDHGCIQQKISYDLCSQKEYDKIKIDEVNIIILLSVPVTFSSGYEGNSHGYFEEHMHLFSEFK